MRDGTTTQTISLQDPADVSRGVQEPFRYYDDCQTRSRNKELFVANQIGKNNNNKATAKFTRQNPNGEQRSWTTLCSYQMLCL